MTSLTPFTDAAEATIRQAQQAGQVHFARKDETGTIARVSFATSAAFNRAMAAEQDQGVNWESQHSAIVVTLANLIGAICAGDPNPVDRFNALMMSVSINVAHRLQLKDGVYYVEPKVGRG